MNLLDMDKRHRHTHQCFKEEPYQHSVSESFQWEAAESDTESLLQERASQQLQLRLNIYNGFHGKPVNASHDTNEDSGEEDLRVFDSLEVSNPQPVRLNWSDCQRNVRNANSQVFKDDGRSHLRCGPNAKVTSKGVRQFQRGPLISVDDSFLVVEEEPERKEVVKDGYMLIPSNQPVIMTLQNNSYDHPYLLHPQYGQNNATPTPPPVHFNMSEATAPSETHNEVADCNALTESAEEQPNQDQAQPKTLQQMDKISKAQKPLDDIVERNKLTLGRNTEKHGSYAKAHTVRIPQNGAKPQQAPKETSSSESRSEVQLQKPQQVSQRSKKKKAERKESLIPTRPQQPPAPGVKAEHRVCLSSLLTKATVKSLNKASSSSQPLAPTNELNTDLSDTLHLAPFTTQKGQESVHLMFSHRRQHGNSEIQDTLSPELQTRHKFMAGADDHMENSPGQWMRMAALNTHLLHEEEQEDDSTEDQAHQVPDTPSSTLSQSSSSYKVLPPIGRPGAQPGDEFSPTQFGPSRESDGYLMQMEKKKLLRTQPTYKMYSLSDYRQLQPTVALQGLGPDYAAVAKTAERMRRQRRYSNVIREHNMKTSRIPRLPPQDPETNSRKVSRLKALEYAKTIAKPLAPGQSKTNHKSKVNLSEDQSESDSFLDGLDLSQLTILELLRKRHEDEKRAVELLRKTHTV